MFAWPFILKRFPEVWRFFTSFLLTYKTGVILVPYQSRSASNCRGSFLRMQFGDLAVHWNKTASACEAQISLFICCLLGL